MTNKTLETVKWISEYAKANRVPILAYVGDLQSSATGFVIENMDGRNAEQFSKLIVTHYEILMGVMNALNQLTAEELIEIHNAFKPLKTEEPGSVN